MLCYTNVVSDYHSRNHPVASNNNDHKMLLIRIVWCHSCSRMSCHMFLFRNPGNSNIFFLLAVNTNKKAL